MSQQLAFPFYADIAQRITAYWLDCTFAKLAHFKQQAVNLIKDVIMPSPLTSVYVSYPRRDESDFDTCVQTTLQGMRLCLGQWYDTGGGHALASIYLHLYNDSDYKQPRLLDAVMEDEVFHYVKAAIFVRQKGYEPHLLGEDSNALMQRIIQTYGKKRRKKR